MPLLEGIGDELVHTVLILGGILLITNLYWFFVARNARNGGRDSSEQQTNHYNAMNIQTNNEPTNSQLTSSPVATSQPPQHRTEEPLSSLDQIVESPNQQQTQSIPERSTIAQNKNNVLEKETTSTNNSENLSSVSKQQGSNPKSYLSENDDSLLGPMSESIEAAISGGDLSIKLQFINGLQRMVLAKSEDTLGEFKREHFSEELSANKKVRLIMNGQELKNEAWSLREHNICNDFVLHCLVSQPASSAQPPSSFLHQQTSPRIVNLGVLFYPTIGAVLAFFWYARIYYRNYFNGASTFSLVVLTCFYAFSILAFFRVPVSSENIHSN